MGSDPRTVSALLLAAALAGCGPRDGDLARRPNVLVVCIDALRADRLGSYGGNPATSPELDALSRESAVFTNAISVASWTKPSVPSILTGLYPEEHGVLHNAGDQTDVLAPGTPTLAGMLSASGYDTAAFVENDQLLREVSGLHPGFSLYLDEAGTPAELAGRFLTWSSAAGRPWFAYLHFLDPHFPYLPDPFTFEPAESARLLARIAHWDLRGDLWWLLRERVNAGSTSLDAAALADLVRLYELEIRAVDAVVGRTLAELDRRGVLDQTMVVVTADHGEGFLERGRIDHGYGPYTELVHVPLLIRFPGRRHAGTRTSALVQNLDIAATVLDVAHVEPPPRWSSRSLLPVLEQKQARHAVLTQERHRAWTAVSARDARYTYMREERLFAEPAAATPAPPASLTGRRIRASGIFDGSLLVAGSLRNLAPGDLDVEIQGPAELAGEPAREVRVLGVPIAAETDATGEPGAESLESGEFVRVHGEMRGARLVPEKFEAGDADSIEIEGVVRGARATEGGDIEIDVGGVKFLADRRARWHDFPEEARPSTPGSPTAAPEGPAVVERLFDRESDPREQKDVASERPADLARMRGLLASLTEPLAARPAAAVGRATLDAATRERLRAMGYVE